jgi:L-malate glycosyltransferase
MKILLISSLYPTGSSPGHEGITVALHNLVKAWSRENNVMVVRPVYLYLSEMTGLKKTAVKKSPRRYFFFLDEIRVIVFPIFKIPRLTYFYHPLYRFLDGYRKSGEFRPDVVVAHYDKSLQIGYHYCRTRELPLLAGIHITPDLMVENPAAFSQRCGKVLDTAAAIACRSGYIYDKVTRWFPPHREKCFHAFSGIEESLIEKPEAGIERMRQWKQGGTLSIISVSSLIPRKNIDTVIRALARLKNHIPWTYTLIGEGAERPALESLAASLGLGHRVRFRGALPRQEVINTLKQSHLFLLVSYLETFGLVYLEALACGNIVVGSKGEGIDGIIQHQNNGFLSPAGEVESLTALLETIIYRLTADQLAKLLENAHGTIKQYTDRIAAQHYMQRLQQIVNRDSSG